MPFLKKTRSSINEAFIFELFSAWNLSSKEDNIKLLLLQTISNLYLKDKSAPRCILPVYLLANCLDRLLTGHQTVYHSDTEEIVHATHSMWNAVVSLCVYEYIICMENWWE